MRLLAGLLLTVCAALLYFSYRLGTYVESTHGASVARMALRRVRTGLREKPELQSIADSLSRDIAELYGWLEAAFLVSVSLSLLLAISAVVMIVSQRQRR